MLGDLAAQERPHPVRPACAPFDLSTLERRRWDLLGRLSDAADVLAGFVHYGVPPWLAACRLMCVMRWLSNDQADVELDPIA